MAKHLPFSINTDVYDNDMDIEPRLAVFAGAGFRFIHWSEHVFSDHVYSRREITRIQRLLSKYGLVCLDIHGVCEVKGQCALTLGQWVNLNVNRMELIRAVGGDTIVLHAPISLADRQGTALDTAREMVDTLLPKAEQLAVALAIENSVGSVGVIEKLLAAYNVKELGLCYDSGHAQIDGSLGKLEAFSDRMLVSHLHDNDGTHDDHNRPGEGGIDWPRVMRFLDSTTHLRTLGLEVGHRTAGDHREWVGQAYAMLTAVAQYSQKIMPNTGKTKPEPTSRAKPRWPGFDRSKEIQWVKAQQEVMPMAVVTAYKQTLARRIAASRKLFKREVLIGDVHTHTVFSDGINTVQEIKAMADAVGLDFVFITDHRTIRQKRYCDDSIGLWWGQEPPSVDTEVALLCPKRLFVPRCDSRALDFERARRVAPFVFVPHPVGYGPDTWFSQEVLSVLWELGERFAIELINGHGKLAHAYDAFSAKTVCTWDALLQAGKQVSVVAGSDAHIAYSVGTTWTGVFTARLDRHEIIGSLAAGHSFASEAPLVSLTCGRAMMGDVLVKPRGSKVRIRFGAVDSAGLHSVGLIRNGKRVRNISARDATRISADFEHRVTATPSYFRVECIASDRRRAFSSPLYVRCQ